MLENPGGIVYGTIIVATLLAAESARQETYLQTIAAVVIALLTYWLTIAYAHYAGERFEHGEHFQLGDFGHAAVRELTLLLGGVIPLIELVIAWIAGAPLPLAVTIDVWFGVALVVVGELLIAIRAGLTGRELVAQTAVGGLLGLLVIGLRIVLH